MRILKSENKMVDESQLRICDSYQRAVNRRRVDRIVKSFDPDAFGSICVGRRSNGTLWVVDGFQRLTAARELGITRVPCDIFDSAGKSHEAEIFRAKNKERTSVGALVVFKAALTAGDPQALAIVKCVESHGLSIPLKTGTYTNHWPNIHCVGEVIKVFARGGSEHLNKVLEVICEAWDGDITALKAAIIGGLSVFLTKVENLDEDRLVKKMKAVDPMAVIRFGENQHKLYGGSRASGVANAFLNFYNKGLKYKVKFTGDED